MNALSMNVQTPTDITAMPATCQRAKEKGYLRRDAFLFFLFLHGLHCIEMAWDEGIKKGGKRDKFYANVTSSTLSSFFAE